MGCDRAVVGWWTAGGRFALLGGSHAEAGLASIEVAPFLWSVLLGGSSASSGREEG